MEITKKKLIDLVKKYNRLVQIKGYSRMKKQDILDSLKDRNYKVHYNEKKKEHELHPIKDPKRAPKINNRTKMPKDRAPPAKPKKKPVFSMKVSVKDIAKEIGKKKYK